MFVPDDIWVTANFKETQLDEMRPGEPATIHIDAYPDRTFKGHVASIQPGSGTAFSLLPAENATGNYVKIVQRVPVKIVLDNPPADLTLGPGMSVEPSVRTNPAASLYEQLRARYEQLRARYERAQRCSRAGRRSPRLAQSLADRGPGRARDLHGGARHDHRQRRAALHRRRLGGQRGRGVLGGDDLSGRQRRRLDGQRLPRAVLRPQGVLPDLPRAVHRELGAVRLFLEPGFPAVLPDPAGARRRRHGAGRAVDPGGFLPAGEARPGLRAVRRGGGRGAGGRADARRLAGRQFFLELVLPDQRPGRRRHDRADRHDPARAEGGGRGAQAGPAGAGRVRSHRLRAGRDLSWRARDHARPRARGRLVRLDLHRQRRRSSAALRSRS